MGSFEFHQTSFSLIDNETREEKFVGVPEQGGRDMISLDPLAPGSVYTSSVDDHAKVGLYRLEVGCSPGTGKLKIAGGIEGLMLESTFACMWCSELTVVYHLWDPTILGCHKEGVYADKSVIAVVVSSGTGGVFYAKGPAAEGIIAYRRGNG